MKNMVCQSTPISKKKKKEVGESERENWKKRKKNKIVMGLQRRRDDLPPRGVCDWEYHIMSDYSLASERIAKS